MEKGSNRRPGIKIKSDNHVCPRCSKKTRHDMWTGDFKEYVASIHLSTELQKKILGVYSHKDIVEQTIRQPNELTIDHKFPLIRWDSNYGKQDNKILSEAKIKLRF